MTETVEEGGVNEVPRKSEGRRSLAPLSRVMCRSMRPLSVVRRLLRSPEDEASLKIGEIAGAQLLHGDRLVIKLAIFDGIITPSDPTELNLCLSAGVSGVQAPCSPIV
jgi:hypothetical protein